MSQKKESQYAIPRFDSSRISLLVSLIFIVFTVSAAISSYAATPTSHHGFTAPRVLSLRQPVLIRSKRSEAKTNHTDQEGSTARPIGGASEPHQEVHTTRGGKLTGKTKLSSRSTSRPAKKSTKAHKDSPTTKHPTKNTINSPSTKATSKGPSVLVSSSTVAPVNSSESTTKRPQDLVTTLTPKTSKIDATRLPNSNTSSLLTSKPVPAKVRYDPRDIAYFLEGHHGHPIHDPRAYFTDERTSRSLAVMLDELQTVPPKLRFSFIVRVFNELGRKIASKLSMYGREVLAILLKMPDDLGNKPEVSMLADAVHKTFESKQDEELPDDSSDGRITITSTIKRDKEKEAVFNASLIDISVKFARTIGFFFNQANKTAALNIPKLKLNSTADLLTESMRLGAATVIRDLNKGDKFYIKKDLVSIMSKILSITAADFKFILHQGHPIDNKTIAIHFPSRGKLSFKDLNQISDSTGLIGPWNNHLFNNLGSAERVVKLFASLLSRVPEKAKSRWINMYWTQVEGALERTMSGFVTMQTLPRINKSSDLYLLDPKRSASIIPNKLPRPRDDYLADQNRVPARCYLAGRRWRLVLARSLGSYPAAGDVFKKFSDKISALKLAVDPRAPGNEATRLCLPRLEVGLRGWAIDGDPHKIEKMAANFLSKNPIDSVDSIGDPFSSGIKLGYHLGFKIGYNEKRNASLEMELINGSGKGASGGGGQEKIQRASAEVHYLAAASYRHGATAGARKAFGLAIREGYMSALKLSLRSGMRIPAETGSRIASLRGTSFGGQAGLEAGRSIVNKYLMDRDLDDRARLSFIRLGETHGVLGGEIAGGAVGALVGKLAAEEAYKNTIVRGGKIGWARFLLDEYEAGAKLGFEYGVKEGERVASSSSLDPAAPKVLRLRPPFGADLAASLDYDVDQWEKDLIPPLRDEAVDLMHKIRNHTLVSGTLMGSYRMTKEVKRMGLNRLSFTNSTYNLDVRANGFMINDVAYLTLSGRLNNIPFLHGSLVAEELI